MTNQLPTLIGTMRQIAFAAEIRAAKIVEINQGIDYLTAKIAKFETTALTDAGQAKLDAMRAGRDERIAAAAETSAKWWIEKARYATFRASILNDRIAW